MSTLTLEELINIRTSFLKTSDKEISSLCKSMEQELTSPIYWFTSLEESNTKRKILSYERYQEFCNFILENLLEEILTNPDNKNITKK